MCCIIFKQQSTSTSPVVKRQNTFEKKLDSEMLIEQINKFELRRPWPPGRTCTPTTGYFCDKTKLSKQIYEWIIIMYC